MWRENEKRGKKKKRNFCFFGYPASPRRSALREARNEASRVFHRVTPLYTADQLRAFSERWDAISKVVPSVCRIRKLGAFCTLAVSSRAVRDAAALLVQRRNTPDSLADERVVSLLDNT